MVNLRDILRENDLVGEVLSAIPLTNTPSRVNIELALVAGGYTLPLPNKVSFHLFDGSKMFLVTWFPALDKYGYEKLTLK